MSFRKLFSGAVCTFATVLSAHAATVPYVENFDGDTLGTSSPSEVAPESGQFTTTTAGAWTVVSGSISGDLDFQDSFSAGGTPVSSTAAINFSGALGGALKQDWSMSTEFKLDTATVTSSNITIGFGALGANSSFGGGSAAPYYLADVIVADVGTAIGRVRILEVNSSNTTFDEKSSGVAINTTDTYRLTLQGAYVGDSLVLSFTFENLTTPNPETGNGSFTITATDTTPLTGSYFGYRNRINVTGSLDANFDNFAVVPEPASGGLLCLGAVGLLARRRRN